MKNGKRTLHKPVIMIDFGGVYFTYAKPGAERFAKKYGIPFKKVDGALMGTNWTKHATGRSSEKAYWTNAAKNLGISQKQADELRRNWYSHTWPQDGMAILVKKLKEKYTVVALSSIIAGWIEFLEKKYKISNRFHDHHYSYDHRVDKPSAELFLRAAKKMGAKPEDCIVVDDMKDFLAAVRRTGARTMLFKDAKQLEMQLRKNGVQI